MQTRWFKKIRLSLFVLNAATAFSVAFATTNQAPSRVLPQTAFPSFWDGFSFGLGGFYSSLMGEKSDLYKFHAPGVQLSISQHLRPHFMGTLAARASYWTQNKRGGEQSQQAVTPIVISSHIVGLAPLREYPHFTLGGRLKPFVSAGPGVLFFSSQGANRPTTLPTRSSWLEAGVGVYFLPREWLALRLAYHYGKSSSALGLNAGTTSFEMQVGSVDDVGSSSSLYSESP